MVSTEKKTEKFGALNLRLPRAVINNSVQYTYHNYCESIGHFRNINIQLDSEAERTKTIKVAMNVKDISISSTFLCLLNLSFKLNFNISKVVLYISFC